MRLFSTACLCILSAVAVADEAVSVAGSPTAATALSSTAVPLLCGVQVVPPSGDVKTTPPMPVAMQAVAELHVTASS